MSDPIVLAVAKAIQDADTDIHVAYDVLARAAIDAYEAAKKKAEEPYVTRVEKGVTYWSNGLCSQSVPGSKEFAEAQLKALQEASATIPDLMRGLNPFDDEPTRLRSYEAKWERPE